MHTKPRTLSLRLSVVLALAISLLMPLAIVHYTDFKRGGASAQSQLQSDLDQSSNMLAAALSDALWQLAPDQTESLVKALGEDSRYVSIVVRLPDRKQPFLEYRQMAGATGWTLAKTIPIRRDRELIGELQLEMTNAPYIKALHAELQRDIQRSLTTLGISIVIILMILQFKLFRPIETLLGSANRLAEGRLEHPVGGAGESEIGRIARTLENMRQSLLDAFQTLRQHASTLEDKVKERTTELSTSNKELSSALTHLQTAQTELIEAEKLASLGRLVAGVAHELNTPLGNSLTVVSTLEDHHNILAARIESGVPLRKNELLDLIRTSQRGHDLLRRNVEKAADLIRDFKQVAIDQTSDIRRAFDLAEMIDDVLVTIRPRYKHTPFAIETQLEHGIAMDSYPGPLGQVITNLMLNALTHAFDRREHGKLTISCRRADDHMTEIICADDGIGMDKAVLKRIYDPFFTTKLGKGGSGLGLNIVHNIVTRVLGGQIDAVSQPDQGTTFTLRIPLIAPSTLEAPDKTL